MENLFFFIIIIIGILIIYFIDHVNINNFNINNFNKSGENFNILNLNPYQRCNVLGVNKFMIRDLRTKLWLTVGQQEGFNKFLPGNFGISLLMSDNPNEYLPLRTIADPNDYLLATYKGDGIRVVTNPYNETFVIQVFIYKGLNVLGYIDESNSQLYLYIDDNGNVSSVSNPSEASIVEILQV